MLFSKTIYTSYVWAGATLLQKQENSVSPDIRDVLRQNNKTEYAIRRHSIGCSKDNLRKKGIRK